MGAPSQVVVGTAVVRAGRVLAARRSRPADLAGLWEFPGGKVEQAETEAAALIRECHEELGIVVTVGDLLGSQPIRDGLVLRVYAAEIALGEPTAGADHDEVRWLAPADCDDLAWIDVDRWFVGAVREVLAATR